MKGFKNSTKTQYDHGGDVACYAKGGSVTKSSPKGEAKVGKVMGEFKSGALHSGSKKGPEVTNRKQAVAIALSEARKAGAKVPAKKVLRKADGGTVVDPNTPAVDANAPVATPLASTAAPAPGAAPRPNDQFRQSMQDWRGQRPDRSTMQDPSQFKQSLQDWRGQRPDRPDRPQNGPGFSDRPMFGPQRGNLAVRPGAAPLTPAVGVPGPGTAPTALKRGGLAVMPKGRK